MSINDRLNEIQERAKYARQVLASGTTGVPPNVAGVDVYETVDILAESATDVPALLSALRAVLDLHKPMRMYEHEDSCEDDSEEHCQERHVESTESNGEYYCLDLPTGITLCAECSSDLDFDGRDYPCPTVRAVQAALGEES